MGELLPEIKLQARRWFIAFIICLVLLFISNMAWLYVFQSYDYTSDVYMQDGYGINNYNADIEGDIENRAGY